MTDKLPEETGIGFTTTVKQIVGRTTSVTPLVLLSFPVGPHRIVRATIEGLVFHEDMTADAAVTVDAIFNRSVGNLRRRGSPNQRPIVSTIPNVQPRFDLVANEIGQTIDVVVHGTAGKILRWNLEVTFRETT